MGPSDEPKGAEERIDWSGLGRLSDRPPPPRGERASRVIRVFSVLLLAIAAAGLPWYFATRGGDGGRPGAAVSMSSSPTPTPSPTPSPTGGTYEVFGVDKCVNVRAEPNTGGKRLDCVTLGVQMKSDGLTAEGNGLLWRHVYDPFAKVWGWAADQYLKSVS